MLPTETALAGVPVIELDAAAARLVANGNGVGAPGAPDGTAWARADAGPLAIGHVALGRFQPDRVLVPD